MQRKWIPALFFLAGISSLIYEIAWVRQATLTFGVSIYAYSAVLTAYMGGMALGGYLIGKRADREDYPFKLFALLQVGLAVLGILTPFALEGLSTVYAAVARSLQPGLWVLTLFRLLMSILALTPPAVCIGAILPVMGRAYARRSGQVGGDVGWLSAINTLGSVLGCLLTAAIFLRVLGLRETIFLAAFINLVVAALAWSFKTTRIDPLRSEVIPAAPGTRSKAVAAKVSERRLRHAQAPAASIEKKPAAEPLSAGGLRFIIIAYTISGFVAMAYEVVWARLVSLLTVGAVYSFSVMLAVFLSGLVVGGLLGAWMVRKWRPTLFTFGALQLAIGFLAVVTLIIFAVLPGTQFASSYPTYSIAAEMAFEGGVSFLTLFPVTILIGMVFPVVSSLYTAEQAEHVGLKLSRVTALNTTGSILGSLLAGFVIVPALGMQYSIYLLAGINLLIGMLSMRFFVPQKAGMRLAALTVLVITLGGAVGQQKMKYLGYFDANASQLVFYKEGTESTVAVFDAGEENPKFSTVNGRVEVPTDVLSLRAFYLLGHLPPLLKPDAQNALMLSFGNGIATGTLVTHKIPAVDVVELAPEMVQAAGQVYTQENRSVLAYPGLTIHIEDARNFLLQTGRKFDIITTDATHPSNSSSWTLFTTEFYQQIKQHLTPDGVFLQWVPLHSMSISDYKQILRTYQSVFPTATLWYTGGSHTLLLAVPYTLTKPVLEQKLQVTATQPEVIQELGDLKKIERYWIMNADQLSQFAGPGRLVYDDNAYFLPINAETQQLIQLIQDAAMKANP